MGFFSYCTFTFLFGALVYLAWQGVEGITTLNKQAQKQIDQNETIIATLERLNRGGKREADPGTGDTE